MPASSTGLTTNESHAVPGFRPSLHGFHFANRYPSGPTLRLGMIDPRRVGVGDAQDGLCGGMSWLVRERFHAGLPIPADTVPPENGSPLFRAIVRRQILSLDWLRVPLRFWRFAAMRPERMAQRTLSREWPRIREDLRGGRLSMVGLVRHHGWSPFDLTKDHQVLAYGYGSAGPDGPHELRLYDPNWPDRDDITVTIGRDGFAQSSGEPLLGLMHLG